MVKYTDATLTSTFSALAHPTRRAIVARLALGECTVGELARPFSMSAPAISKHLRQLEGAGLIERQRDGRNQRCRLKPEALGIAADWLGAQQRFWEDSFDRLAEHLAAATGEDKQP